jgi:hypothetical protein
MPEEEDEDEGPAAATAPRDVVGDSDRSDLLSSGGLDERTLLALGLIVGD